MQTAFRSLLILIVLSMSALPFAQAADNLILPKLGDVMKENEKLQKLQKIQKNKIRNKNILSPVLSIQEILAYHTIETGNAVTLSKYDTIDLWVQEISLSK